MIVSTPQKVALADTKKSVAMLEKVNIPIFGLVENMSSFVCPKCNEISHIFGKNEDLLDNVKSLGSVPLEIEIMRNADQGKPIVLTHPKSKTAEIYSNIATNVIEASKVS